ncbi:unnamed protein product [Bemisia tabaci]|uniref:Cation/H+ exchanger transmembrane domain-containing protein n=1 Tax=Bemisia tabaci TaxID=7038 RepID=A0A9P0A162_BEMTA|nr:unnamed protein product [Bemisia tabaci]
MLRKYFSANPRVRLLPWPHPYSLDYGTSKLHELSVDGLEDGKSVGNARNDGAHNCGRSSPESLGGHSSEGSRIRCWKQIVKADSRLVQIFSSIICGLLGWGILYTLFHNEVAPGGQLFSLIFLYLLASYAGYLISFLRLPALLGMLLMGILLRNIGFFDVSGVYKEIIISSREIALTVILIKAGLGLDPVALMKLKFVVLRLALVPCIGEAAAVAAAAHFLLGFPWLWGILLGCTQSAVSPAVVVPTLLNLDSKGYGTNKGISTLIIAASSIDDIFSISAFGVCLGALFTQGDITMSILKGPTEVGLGLFVGILWGAMAYVVPHPDDKYVVLKRFIFVGGGGLFMVLGSQMIGFPGAGPLSCISSAFVANLSWKHRGWDDETTPVSTIISKLWKIVEPLLFALIGTEINFQVINLSLVGTGLLVLFSGLVIRVVCCSIAIYGANLNSKETLFVNMAWLPKATVQAALAPVAMDMVRQAQYENDSPLYVYSSQILTIAVISILVTAPIGSVGINIGGPKLLTKTETHTVSERDP